MNLAHLRSLGAGKLFELLLLFVNICGLVLQVGRLWKWSTNFFFFFRHSHREFLIANFATGFLLSFGCCIWVVIYVIFLSWISNNRSICCDDLQGSTKPSFLILWHHKLDHRNTNFFIFLIWFQMLKGDFLRFFVIYSVFLIGFSEAFYITFNETGIFNFLHRMKVSFIVMLGGSWNKFCLAKKK